MVEPEALKAAGYSDENLKKLLAVDREKMKPEIKSFVDGCEALVRGGVNRNLDNAKWFWAIDQACDISQSQISPTIARGILSNKTQNENESTRIAQELGLSSMITSQVHPVSGKPLTDETGKPILKLDVPAFTSIFVPICLSYVKVRWATLFNGRDTTPLYKYQPLVTSSRSKIKCDIITSCVEQTSQHVGNRDFLRQMIFQTLKYGVAISFAMEPYWEETQVRTLSSVDKDGKETTSKKATTVRQGIRRSIPHPSRTFYDLHSRLNTLNTGTGVKFAGYWDIYRLREIYDGDYWLTDEEEKEREKIRAGVGSLDWMEMGLWSNYSWMFPCAISLPPMHPPSGSELDRTTESAKYVYTADDQGIVLSHIFRLINPKKYKLFDYDHPVWFKITMANGSRVLKMEPYAYNPCVACVYDADQNLSRNATMVSDMIPFQDQMANFLTEYIRTVKRNLVNLVFYNLNGVSPDTIDKLKSMGQRIIDGIHFEGVNPRDLSMDPLNNSKDYGALFQTVHFPKGSTQEIMSGIKLLLEIIERIIGFTAQEVGASGQHVQTAEEIRVIRNFTSSRIALTDSFIGTAVDAIKVQEYDAFMAYGDDKIMAELSDVSSLDKMELEAMGFKVEEGPGRKKGVIGKKAALSMASFVSDREGQRRTDDTQLAAQMLQMFQSIFSNSGLVEAVGVDKIMGWLNTVMEYAGIPREHQFEANEAGAAKPSNEQLLAQVQEMVQSMSAQQMEEMGAAIREKAIQPLQQAIQEVAEGGEAVAAQQQELVNRLQQVEAVLQQAMAPNIPTMV